VTRLRASIQFVCSSQARVGTTSAARLLAEFHRAQGRSVALYDTDAQSRALADLFPDAVVVDVARTSGQMVLFDGLLTAGADVRIVDVCARSYRDCFGRARQLGFFDEARRLGMAVEIFFVTDLAPAAMTSLVDLAEAWPELAPLVVLNEGAATPARSLDETLPGFPRERTIEIQTLATRPGRRPELPDAPLHDACRRAAGTPAGDAMGEWLTQVFTQFRCHELREALAALA
jgi:hypothetical protein